MNIILKTCFFVFWLVDFIIPTKGLYNWSGTYTFDYNTPIPPNSNVNPLCCSATGTQFTITQTNSKISFTISYVGSNSNCANKVISNADVTQGSFIYSQASIFGIYYPNNFSIGINDTANYCLYVYTSANSFSTQYYAYNFINTTWAFFGSFPASAYTGYYAPASLSYQCCLPNPFQTLNITQVNSNTNFTIPFVNNSLCSNVNVTTKVKLLFQGGGNSYINIYNTSTLPTNPSYLSIFYLPYNQTFLLSYMGCNSYYYNTNSSNLATQSCKCKPPNLPAYSSMITINYLISMLLLIGINIV